MYHWWSCSRSCSTKKIMAAFQEKHTPVLYGELTQSLRFFETGKNIIVDCTLGLGWHASWIIEKLEKWDIFIGLDCDQDNLTSAKAHIEEGLKEKKNTPTTHFIHSNFGELDEVLDTLKLSHITAIYADLWVSSVHFDTPERGFSFRFDGPLDMRLDSSHGKTAAELINTLPYEKMAEIFRIYGDEVRAGFIAKKIIEARTIKPIETTKELADIVTKAWRDAVPRIFQALRIAVNEEYSNLEKMLSVAHDKLASGGSISIIAFHSGEDRIVKHFFREKSTPERDPITGQDTISGTIEVITKKPITPTDKEIQENPRSRSALLRIAHKK